MLVGTVKSGKSTLLHTVLPGLIAAEYASGAWPAGRPRPVIFAHTVTSSADAETAAYDLQAALAALGRTMDVPFNEEPTPRAALANLPAAVAHFAKGVRHSGGELWLLLDGLQAPQLSSTTLVARIFTEKLKMVSSSCCTACF